MMFWNNRRREGTPFLWGMVVGVISSFYFSKWFLNRWRQPQQGQQEKVQSTKSTSEAIGQKLNDTIEQMDNSEKKALFDTFVKASDEEQKDKTENMNEHI